MLRRSGDDWNRFSHCYITAYRFPVDRVEEAVKLIKFGNERYASEKSYLVSSNQMLGSIYRRACLYKEAYDTYLQIYPDIGSNKGGFPWCLLEAKMYADNFNYSQELEEYIEHCEKENVISRAFRKNQFVEAMAGYIVAEHYGDMARMASNYEIICELLAPDYKGPLEQFLNKHRIEEEIEINDDCMAFLKNISKRMC